MKIASACTMFLTSLILTATQSIADDSVPRTLSAEDHRQEILDWRQRRHDRLSSENGWLTLVGLNWLNQGASTIGSGESADVRVPGGPDQWGIVTLKEHSLQFNIADGSGVSVETEPGLTHTSGTVDLLADNQGEPSIVRSNNLSFYVIYRESYGIRVKDTQAPVRVNFNGIDNFDIDHSWRIDGEFRMAEPGTTIEIGNVLGQVIPMKVHGTIHFERDGQAFDLVGLEEEGSDSLWFIFSDKTSGKETYGAGRFLYSEGMPDNGRLVVDFNKAYNPPCAFNDYSTCPLPPQRNRMRVQVTAGEKKFH